MPKHDATPELADDSAEEVATNLATPRRSTPKSSKSKTYSSALKAKANKNKRVQVESESEAEEEVTEKDSGGGSDEEEDEEFEIESIEDVEIGGIPEHPDDICFYVKWKGYPGEDSWTTEENAVGAAELIRKFWRARKRAGEPSRDDSLMAHQRKKEKKAKSKSRPTKGGRKSSTSVTPNVRNASPAPSSEDLGEKVSKKRATTNNKKSASSAHAPAPTSKRPRSPSPQQMEVDQTDADNSQADPEASPPPTKKRKSTLSTALNGRNASKMGKMAKESSPIVEEELPVENELVYRSTWRKYGRVKNWEKLVDRVSTVEHDPADPENLSGKGLWVLFVDVDGEAQVTRSTIMHERAPVKLCQFYESNLKFRPNDGKDP